MNIFLAGLFLVGLVFAPWFDTWMIAWGLGGLPFAYYSVKNRSTQFITCINTC